jgi:hypothetical protein
MSKDKNIESKNVENKKYRKVKISKYKNIETRTSLNLLNNVERKNVEGKISKVQCRSKKNMENRCPTV